MYLRDNDMDIDILKMGQNGEIVKNSGDTPPEEQPDYGKGKLNKLYDYLFGWSPKKFYNEKIKEPIKSKLPNWSPTKFYNDKVKQSEIYKILFND